MKKKLNVCIAIVFFVAMGCTQITGSFSFMSDLKKLISKNYNTDQIEIKYTESDYILKTTKSDSYNMY